jgi:hypothetical protein
MQPPNYCIQNPSEQQQEKNKAKKKIATSMWRKSKRQRLRRACESKDETTT